MRAIVLTAYVTAFLAGPICQIECLPFAISDASATQTESSEQAQEGCPHHQSAAPASSEGSSDRPPGHRDSASEAICLDLFLSSAQAPSAAPEFGPNVVVALPWTGTNHPMLPLSRRAAGFFPADFGLRSPPPKIYLRDLRFLN